jgi:hypothetical protein
MAVLCVQRVAKESASLCAYLKSSVPNHTGNVADGGNGVPTPKAPKFFAGVHRARRPRETTLPRPTRLTWQSARGCIFPRLQWWWWYPAIPARGMRPTSLGLLL